MKIDFRVICEMYLALQEFDDIIIVFILQKDGVIND